MPEISSPCVRICSLDPESRICTGCGRTLDEIANWLRYSQERRLSVTAALGSRLERLKRRAAG